MTKVAGGGERMAVMRVVGSRRCSAMASCW